MTAANSNSGEPSAAAAVAIPRDAATVVVLRESAGGLEALLLKRPAGARVAGGEWVFPGGCVEAVDCSEGSRALAHGADVRMLAALRSGALGARRDTEFALGLCVCACRETFEESGILFARRRSGAACGARFVRALQEERLASGYTAAAFGALLERHDLVAGLDALVYFSSWITPTSVPRRFDARFFLARLPAGQEVATRLIEAEAARWLPVADRCDGPEVDPPITAPPTLLTLRELALIYARQGSLARLLDAVRGLQPARVMVKIVQRSGARDALFPWDADYAATAGVGVPCDEALRQRLGHFPSRIAVKLPRGNQ